MRSVSKKLHALLVWLIIVTLALFMLSIGYRLVADHLLTSPDDMENVFSRMMSQGDAKAPSASQGSTGMAAPTNGTVGTNSPKAALRQAYRQYTSLINQVTHTAETYANQKLIFRRPVVELANSYERSIGWNLAGYSEYNNVIDLGEGYLTTFWTQFNVTRNVEAVAQFKQHLDTQGLPLLFVQLPSKVARQDTTVNNVVDFYNDNANRLVSGLRENGVQTLDLRDSAEQLNIDYRSLFYFTDHHWRAEAGLWAAGEISQELNRSFGFSIDSSMFKPGNYVFEHYERSFLGSLGKKVTLARATPDDFELIYPKFDVNLSLNIPAIDLDTTGGFDIIFDFSQLGIEDLYERELYGMYLHNATAQHGVFQLTNHLAQPGAKKVLVLGDSFNYALVPYLALGLGHLDYVDLRNHLGSLGDIIADGGYDQVIISHSSLYPVDFESGTDSYDFR